MSQNPDPFAISVPALLPRGRIGEPWVRGDDRRVAEAHRRGLDEPNRDPAAHRVTDDAIDAVREFAQQTLYFILKGAGGIFPVAMPRQVDGQECANISYTPLPVVSTTGESMQEQAVWGSLDQSDASAIFASSSLSRSIKA